MHFFTVGAGALFDGELTYLDNIGKDTKTLLRQKHWPCQNENKNNGESFCHFGWFSKAEEGGYAVINIQNITATVKILSSEDDILYQKVLQSRKSISQN